MPKVGPVRGGRVELGWAPRNCCYDDICFCCSHTEHGCLVVAKAKEVSKKGFCLLIGAVACLVLLTHLHLFYERCGSSSTVGRWGNTFLQTNFQPIFVLLVLRHRKTSKLTWARGQFIVPNAFFNLPSSLSLFHGNVPDHTNSSWQGPKSQPVLVQYCILRSFSPGYW
jgi:hypothetical protein